MNPDLNKLQPYPFEKLVNLKKNVQGNPEFSHIALSIGEPKHEAPKFALETLAQNLPAFGQYPVTKGIPELRQTICSWLIERCKLTGNVLDPEKHVLPVNGSREALFAFAQAIINRSQPSTVLMPNPFYQIYEGAALLAGAEPIYINSTEENNYQPDFSSVTEEQWQRCQLLYLCSPNNPTGSVLSLEDFQNLIKLADKHQFVIASDECYSEIYSKHTPISLLEACQHLNRDDFKRCIVFHSLSKRSNLPGLRSGFVAGDAELIKQFLLYRTYHGCAMPIPNQLASIQAWQDENHVRTNRKLYQEKFNRVEGILQSSWAIKQPQAGFNFWAKTPIDDQKFTQLLFQRKNITVLPGSYLSRSNLGINPGKNHIRMAMVAPIEECVLAAERIKQFIESL